MTMKNRDKVMRDILSYIDATHETTEEYGMTIEKLFDHVNVLANNFNLGYNIYDDTTFHEDLLDELTKRYESKKYVRGSGLKMVFKLTQKYKVEFEVDYRRVGSDHARTKVMFTQSRSVTTLDELLKIIK